MNFSTSLPFVLCALLLTVACAQPKYESPATPPGPNQKVASAAPACLAEFTTNHLCLDYAWEQLPTESKMGKFLVKLSRPNHADASPVLMDLPENESLELKLWMPSMGHGSSPVTVTRLDTGTYRVENVFFIMRGHWEFRFSLKKDSGVADNATIPVQY